MKLTAHYQKIKLVNAQEIKCKQEDLKIDKAGNDGYTPAPVN